MTETVDSQALDWRDFAEASGVRYKVLRHHESGGGITLLLQFAPGATYPAHRHPAGEEYFVLEGSLQDAGRTYGANTFVYHPPGSAHRPTSSSGCTLIVTLPAAIERLDD